MKFLVYSEFAEIADLASHLQDEGHTVVLHVPSKAYKSIYKGILEHVEDWHRYIGEEYIWVFDSCSFGDLQDWLRAQGENVVGGCALGDDLENNRQLAQEWFKEAGFEQPWSKNFTDIDEVIEHVTENPDQRYILKQNGDAPKSISHMGKFPGSEDMLFHLEELKKGWNEQEYGEFNCDLMEVVEGLEVAASVFFNGQDYLKNSAGKVVGYLNFEEKKEADDGLGETCGEMGTTFLGVTEDNELFRDIVLREQLVERLRSIGFHGVFDINCILADSGLVALEPTMRFGVPATSYEFTEGLDTPCGDLLEALAKGINRKIEVHEGVGMVMCVVAKPFPIESDVDDNSTSIGEKVWILEEGKPIAEFTEDQRQHIHLYNFEKKDGTYKVVTKGGYLLTVTGRGETIAETRESLIEYIKDNLYLPGMKYRTDIGKRVEEHEEAIRT